MEKIALTEKEYDLIMSIRNYKKSYPNGYPEILWYIERLFNELLDDMDDKEGNSNEHGKRVTEHEKAIS